MSLEFITELEHKIDYLVGVVTGLKAERDRLAHESDGKNHRISELEAENSTIRTELDTLRADASGKQGAIDTAADRIRSMIARLEGVA